MMDDCEYVATRFKVRPRSVSSGTSAISGLRFGHVLGRISFKHI